MSDETAKDECFLSLQDCEDAVSRKVVLWLATGSTIQGKMLHPDHRGRVRVENVAENGERATFVVPREAVLFYCTGTLVDIVSPLMLKQ